MTNPTCGRRPRPLATAVVAAVLALLGVLATTSSAPARTPVASERAGWQHPARCAAQLDHAVRTYLRTTERHDARGFIRLLSRDYTAVLPGGPVFAGRAEGAEFIRGFFARTDWTQTFTETRRTVEGCRTALVLLDSVYTDGDGAVPLVIGLSWIHRHGQWRVLLDQNTVKQ